MWGLKSLRKDTRHRCHSDKETFNNFSSCFDISIFIIVIRFKGFTRPHYGGGVGADTIAWAFPSHKTILSTHTPRWCTRIARHGITSFQLLPLNKASDLLWLTYKLLYILHIGNARLVFKAHDFTNRVCKAQVWFIAVNYFPTSEVCIG